MVQRYHGHLPEFGYGKHLIVPLLALVGFISPGSFGLGKGIVARLRLANIRTVTNHGLTKLARYAAEGNQKHTIRYN